LRATAGASGRRCDWRRNPGRSHVAHLRSDRVVGWIARRQLRQRGKSGQCSPECSPAAAERSPRCVFVTSPPKEGRAQLTTCWVASYVVSEDTFGDGGYGTILEDVDADGDLDIYVSDAAAVARPHRFGCAFGFNLPSRRFGKAASWGLTWPILSSALTKCSSMTAAASSR
jgi:hypothetical protein